MLFLLDIPGDQFTVRKSSSNDPDSYLSPARILGFVFPQGLWLSVELAESHWEVSDSGQG